LGMGTSVASALTAETVFEIIKCISDVDMPTRGRMGSKSEILRFFNCGYAHDRNIWIFRRRASTVAGNTLGLIKPNYASVRQSRDSVHRAIHNMTKKKSRRRRALKPLELRKLKKCTETTCVLAHYHTCKFGINRVRIDGGIRQKPL